MLESITSLRQAKPLAYVFAALTATFMFFLMTSSAFAAAPTMTAATDDVDHNGTVDRITITFSEASQISDGNAGDGLTSIALGSGCTIPNLAYGSANTTTLAISNLTGCTSGSTSITPSVTYTQPAADCVTAGTICDVAGTGLMANGTTTTSVDNAPPVLLQVTFTSAVGTVSAVVVNQLNFIYSEAMTITDGASSTTIGNITVAGTVAGLGTFGTAGNVTVPTTKNTLSGNGTTTIMVQLADQAGGYLETASTTAPSGVVTPAAPGAFLHEVAAAALQVNNTVTPTAGSSAAWDLAKPTITSVTTADVNGAVQNGKVDRATIVFNTAVRDSNITNGEALLGGATHTGTFTTGTANDATTQFNLTADTLAVDTSPTAAHFTYVPSATKITDLAGNLLDTATDGAIADADVVETDGAAAVLVSTSPLNSAVSVSKTAVVTLTFSEILTTMTFTVVGQSVADYTKNLGAAAATLTPIGAMAGGYHAITVATAVDAAGNTYAGVTGAAVNPFHFTVITSATDTVVTPASYTMLVTAPNGGEALVGGATQNITWSSSQTNSTAMNNVNISYTTDAGVTYNTIANNEANDGSYNWTVPSIDAAMVFVKVSGTDLVTVLASDSSDSEFSISSTAVVAPSTGTSGVSPVTGLAEDVSVVAYGNYIKSPFYDTVYYVDYGTDGSTLIRRPFNDHQTFITYQANFNNVITVTDATLPTLSLGGPMMPKPGVVLVKIQTVNKVYAIGTSGELRWITSEEVASSIYGSNWSDYVIDIPDTLYPRFTHGTDITTDENIDVSGMKTRAEVNM